MKNNNRFKGTLYYTYRESGNSHDEFRHLYDIVERKTDCILELPNSEGKFVIQFNFATPDGKHQEHIEHDFKNIIINGGVNLLFGIHFYNYTIDNNHTFINGDFIYEIKKEDDFHAFGCKLKIDDDAIIQAFESNELFFKKQED